MKRVTRRILRSASLALIGVSLVVLLGFVALVWQVNSLGQRDEARQSDVIAVLGARVEGDGQPSPDLRSRVLHAVDVWKAGLAPYLICTGGFKDEWLSAAAVCRRLAIERGVPANRVFLADGTTNTVEDAQVAAAVMADHGWRTAILVSHPLHLFRARWLFQREGIDAVTSPTSTLVERIDLPLRIWYSVRETGAIVGTAFDIWRWLPPGWKTQMYKWSYGLP